MNKEVIRGDILEALSSLSSEEIQSLSFSLTNQLIKFFAMFPELTGEIGAGYLPLKTELAPVYQELLKAVPLAISFPIMSEGEMEFAIPDGPPRGGIWLDPPYKKVVPLWLFVPGVGFGKDGSRLGRGKGFYDRYLESGEFLTIGLAWTGQMKEKMPVESHDFHMDFIITENYCWDVKQQKMF